MHHTTLKINEIAIEYFSDNNSKFAKAMNTSEANIRNYRNGTLPKVDFIIRLCENLEISFEWFLLGVGKKNTYIFRSDKNIKDIGIIKQDKTPGTIIINKQVNDIVALVSKNDAKDYIDNYNSSEFINKLKSYNFPNLSNVAHRMFEVSGNHMYPTLDDGAFVVGEWVKDWINELINNQVYIIISLSHGIIINRILNRIDEFGNIYCKSDNRNGYSDFVINVKDILEIWEYKMHIIYKLHNPTNLQDRVTDLEARLIALENKK